MELDQVCRCTRNTPCIPFLRSAALCPAGRPILTPFLASSRLPSPPSVALSLSGQSEAERSSDSHRRWLLEAGCSFMRARKPRVAVWRWRGWGSRTHSQRVDCCTCACVSLCGLIACAWRESPICMDRGARGEKGEEGRERRNRCKRIVDAKMRFAKTRPVFPCAAHANSFTRVPGRNAATQKPNRTLGRTGRRRSLSETHVSRQQH